MIGGVREDGRGWGRWEGLGVVRSKWDGRRKMKRHDWKSLVRNCILKMWYSGVNCL